MTAVLHRDAGLFPYEPPAAPGTTAWLLANCHVPVPSDLTRLRTLNWGGPGLLSPLEQESTLHEPGAPFPFLHLQTVALIHIPESSPILRCVILLCWPAPCAVRSFYQQARLLYPGRVQLHHPELHTWPLPPPRCNRRQRWRAARRVVVPEHLTGYSSTRWCCAGSDVAPPHLARHPSAPAAVDSNAPAALRARGVSHEQPPVR